MTNCRPMSRATAARATTCWQPCPAAGFTRLRPAEGAFYLYADVADRTNDSAAFCARMLAEAGVAATPGVDFDRSARQPLPAVQLLRAGGGHGRGGRAARPLAGLELAGARLRFYDRRAGRIDGRTSWSRNAGARRARSGPAETCAAGRHPGAARHRRAAHGRRHPRAGHRRRRGRPSPAIPGMPMGMADVATVLWTPVPEVRRRRPALAGPRPVRALGRPRLDAALRAAAPDRPRRHGRSRSCSASASSHSPGRRATPNTASIPAIETTTGPLGQGLGQRGRHGAGRAACWPRGSASRWSTTAPGSSPRDGDLMEGISHEAVGLAGHLRLDKLTRALRRQQHLDRRRHRPRLHRTTR